MCKKKIIFSFVIMLLFSNCKETKSEQNVEIKKNIKKTSLILPTKNEIGEINNIYSGCGYNYTLSESKINLKVATEREIEQIKSILSYSGLPINFEIYSSDIENAVAVMIDNKRYIIYDPKLLQYTDENSNSYWTSMSILAHEIGHHLSGHTLNNNDDKLNNELQADKFSGFILYKLGATLLQAQKAINQLGTEQDTGTHPSKYKRMDIIKMGWEEASVQRYESAIPPPPSDDKSFGGEQGTYKDEFFKEEIIGEKELNEENFGGVINKYNYPDLEGIIIDVEKKGYDGDMRAENFDRNPSDKNMALTIQMTKDSKSPFGDIYKNGTRIKFNLMDYDHTSLAELSWLEALLVPGRKIKFKSFYYGYEAEDIFYVKKLNR
jgi:hypothetical protein